MPVNLNTVKSFVVSQNISWHGSDDAPGVDPPNTSATDERRFRLIYDMFLTSVRPNGSNIQSKITDEVIINLPLVALHEVEDCSVNPNEMSFGEIEPADEQPNPFAALSELKRK